MNRIRRQLLGGLIAGGAGASILSLGHVTHAKQESQPMPQLPNNQDFYQAGVFQASKAKQAYYAMMERFGYPIPPCLRTDEFWTLDFGLGQFSQLGMAGIFWLNNLADNYFGHEIFLLPGQMIPEHRHLKTALAGPKMEGWQVRHGRIATFGEGEPTTGWQAIIPQAHQGEYLQCRNFKQLLPGEVNQLAGAEQWHFMVAGPEGAIVTEYATYHDADGLRFSHPQAKL